MEKEYLEMQSILASNRAKYEEMFAGLAAILDERGVSAEELTTFLGTSIYCPPEN